jgi:hypothetical protein
MLVFGLDGNAAAAKIVILQAIARVLFKKKQKTALDDNFLFLSLRTAWGSVLN